MLLLEEMYLLIYHQEEEVPELVEEQVVLEQMEIQQKVDKVVVEDMEVPEQQVVLEVMEALMAVEAEAEAVELPLEVLVGMEEMDLYTFIAGNQ